MTTTNIPDTLATRIAAVARASHRMPEAIVQLCILHYLPKLESAADALAVFQPPEETAAPTPAPTPAVTDIVTKSVDDFWEIVYATLGRRKNVCGPAVEAWCLWKNLPYSSSHKAVGKLLGMSTATIYKLPSTPSHNEDSQKILRAVTGA